MSSSQNNQTNNPANNQKQPTASEAIRGPREARKSHWENNFLDSTAIAHKQV